MHWSDVRIYSLTIAELWVNRIKQRHFASCFLGQMIRYIRNHHRMCLICISWSKIYNQRTRIEHRNKRTRKNIGRLVNRNIINQSGLIELVLSASYIFLFKSIDFSFFLLLKIDNRSWWPVRAWFSMRKNAANGGYWRSLIRDSI